MDALPYYKWYWQDWRANRRVQRLPWQAKGPYRELLDEFWAEGSLPNDMGELADIVGCTTEELTELWVHIGPCWEERDGRLYNCKMDEQRTATDKARVAMANGGFKGGKASNSHTRAYPKPTLSQPQAKPDIEEERRGEKTKEEKRNTLAVTADALPAERGKLLGTILLNQGEYEVREDDLARDKPLYPAVDVLAEYRAMKAWSIANPQHRKTRKGISRFMNQWLSKAQNSAKGGKNGTNRINSPALEREARSNAAIRRAAERLWGPRNTNEPSEGFLSESGDSRGYRSGTPSGVGGDRGEVQDGSLPDRSVERSQAVGFLSPPVRH